MLHLHENLLKANKKSPMPILSSAYISNGYCFTTNLEVALKSNSCDGIKEGLYRIINKELFLTDMNAFHFPAVKHLFDLPEGIELDSSFIDTLSKAAEFCSSEQMRPAMMGVYCDKSNIVATNGHYMFIEQTDVDINDFLIPADSIKFLIKTIKAARLKNYTFRLSVTKDGVLFSFPSFQFYTRQITESYPKYKSVIPADAVKRVISFNRKELIDTLNALKPFGKSVKWVFDNNNLTWFSENIEEGLSKTINIESTNIYPFSYGDNFRLLMPQRIEKEEIGLLKVDLSYLLLICKSSDKERINIFLHNNFVKNYKALRINFE